MRRARLADQCAQPTLKPGGPAGAAGPWRVGPRKGFRGAAVTAETSPPIPLIDIPPRRGRSAGRAEFGDSVIVATGSPPQPRQAACRKPSGKAHWARTALAFFRRDSPRSSIVIPSDMSVAWLQSRYGTRPVPAGRAPTTSIAPLTREQYFAFVDGPARPAGGHKVSRFHGLGRAATPYFDGCLPIEVMAEARGREDAAPTGPMKGRSGLTNPHAAGR